MIYSYDHVPFRDEEERLENHQPLKESCWGYAGRAPQGTTKIDTAMCHRFITEGPILPYAAGTWKRRGRRVFKNYADMDIVYRTFEDINSNLVVTVAAGQDEMALYKCDLRPHFNAIDNAVKAMRKTLVGIDNYGTILYNPVNKCIFLPMSDCGVAYVDDVAKIPKMTDKEKEDAWERDIDNYPIPPGITEILYADESEPEPEMGYMPVGCILDQDDVDMEC